MRRSVGKLIVAVLTVTGLALSAGAGWETDFESAKKAAAEKNLPILVAFTGSDWCGWCVRLDKEVFEQQAFLEYAEENLVLFQADFPANKPQPDSLVKQNRELQSRYGVRGFPTVLILDKDGKVQARTGYRRGGAEAYVAHVVELLKGE
jgi:protein disulfide-isomerase